MASAAETIAFDIEVTADGATTGSGPVPVHVTVAVVDAYDQWGNVYEAWPQVELPSAGSATTHTVTLTFGQLGWDADGTQDVRVRADLMASEPADKGDNIATIYVDTTDFGSNLVLTGLRTAENDSVAAPTATN